MSAFVAGAAADLERLIGDRYGHLTRRRFEGGYLDEERIVRIVAHHLVKQIRIFELVKENISIICLLGYTQSREAHSVNRDAHLRHKALHASRIWEPAEWLHTRQALEECNAVLADTRSAFDLFVRGIGIEEFLSSAPLLQFELVAATGRRERDGAASGRNNRRADDGVVVFGFLAMVAKPLLTWTALAALQGQYSGTGPPVALAGGLAAVASLRSAAITFSNARTSSQTS